MMRWLLAVMMVLSAACDRGSNSSSEARLLRFDQSLQAGINDRATQGISGPKASAAFDAWIDGIASDARVLAAGTQLGEQIMADPGVAGAVETLMGKMIEDPQVIAAVEQMMAQHPGASQEQIGELFGQRFEQRWDTPEVNAKWFESWDAFLSKLGTSRELSSLYDMVTNRIVSDLDSATLDGRINKRIIALNDGKTPDSSRAMQIYLDHAWAPGRVEDIAVKLVSNPTVKTASATFVAKTLALPEVTAELQKQSARLVTNPKVQARVERAMIALFALELDIAKVGASLHDLMTDPIVVSGVGEVLSVLGKSPKVRALAADWYTSVKNDVALKRELEAFMVSW